MLDRREEYSMDDGSDSNLSQQHQNKLAPLLPERQYANSHNTLPSISSHFAGLYPQTYPPMHYHSHRTYYHQPPNLHHSNYEEIDPILRPSNPQPATAAPSQPTRSTPTSLALQGESAFAYPAEFVSINPAMTSKLAPKCSENCLCFKCRAAVDREYKTESNSSATSQGLRAGKSGHGKGVSKNTRRVIPASKSSNPSKSAMSARTKLFNDKLDAVNGVIIPSKLLPGTLPNKHISKATSDTHLTLFCPRCKGAFGKNDHVKSHFVACVRRNGNPDGLRWDDLPAGIQSG